MAFNFKQFGLALNRYKEGMLVGAVVGFGLAHYAVTKGYDLNTLVTAGKGLADSLFSRSAPIQIAQYKFYGTLTLLGAVVGFYIDMLIERLRLRRN